MRVVSGEAMRYGLRQGDANGKRASENEYILHGPMKYISVGSCSIYSTANAVYIHFSDKWPGRLKNEKIRRGEKMD